MAAVANETDGLAVLERQRPLIDRLSQLTPEQAAFRYADGKWSVKEVTGHLSDAERVLAYRLLRVARGDQTPLPGYDENAFVVGSNADRRTLGDLAAEFAAVRVHHDRTGEITRRRSARPDRDREQLAAQRPRVGVHHRGTLSTSCEYLERRIFDQSLNGLAGLKPGPTSQRLPPDHRLSPQSQTQMWGPASAGRGIDCLCCVVAPCGSSSVTLSLTDSTLL